MKSFAPLLVVFLLLLPPIAGWAEVTDKIIAIVNDDIVTLREVERYVAVQKKSRYSSMNEYVRDMALRERIDTFVEGLLITQQAKKLKIEVGEKEVEAAIENIKKQNLISDAELREQLKREDRLQGFCRWHKIEYDEEQGPRTGRRSGCRGGR